MRCKFLSRAGLNCAPLLRDALHVAHRDQSAQHVLVIHYQQFVDAEMLGEKFIRAPDWIPAEFAF